MDKLAQTLNNITGLDYKLMEQTQDRLDNLTKPQGSLGRLEELAKLIVGITRNENPEFKNKVIFTLAGDHGVTEEHISAYPKEVTAQMVYNFLRGGAGINVLANHIGAKVIVVDMGVAEKINPPSPKGFGGLSAETLVKADKIQNFKDRKINYGTKNFVKGPAMTKGEAIRSIETGIKLVEEELSAGMAIIGTGDMGIGNTTASTAIATVFINRPVQDLTGRGTGIDDEVLKNKIKVIEEALKVNQPDPNDAIDVLVKVGGFEIGGLAGIILGAAAKRTPVVIDGFISGAACVLAYNLEPKIKDYCIASHRSQEFGHKTILEYLGLKPLLDLEMRLGEGTGACLGINIVEAAVKVLTQMATFKSAQVSERIK